MKETKNKPNLIKGIISIIILIAVLYYFFGGGMDKQVYKEMTKVENKVADDAVAQYEIAKRGGDKMDIYTHSSLAAAAFLQSKDEVNYTKWKAIEKEDAKAAGLPDQ